jgi:hypothetical protein
MQGTQRFMRDLFRIQAEIISEHFQPETLAKMAQVPPDENFQNAHRQMQDDALRSFAIDIETDSTIAADEIADKQGVAEFTQAMSSYLGQIFPIVQQQPRSIKPLGRMMLWMARKFRIARDVEDEIEDFLQAFEQLPEDQKNAQNAEAQQKQAEMQMEAQKTQAELQLKQQESQAEIQRKNQESQAAIAREERKSGLEERKLLLDIAEKEAKIRLMQEEAEAKTVLTAVDQAEKRLSEKSKPKETGGKTEVSVSAGDAKGKTIELIKDEKGKAIGAEIKPKDLTKRVKFNRDATGSIASADVE